VNVEEIKFSGGFTDLYTEIYRALGSPRPWLTGCKE